MSSRKTVQDVRTVDSQEVTKFTDGSYWCNCPAFKFSRLPVESRACAHTETAFGGGKGVKAKKPSGNGRYVVTRFADDTFWCTCPAFKWAPVAVEYRSFKHVTEVYGVTKLVPSGRHDAYVARMRAAARLRPTAEERRVAMDEANLAMQWGPAPQGDGK